MRARFGGPLVRAGAVKFFVDGVVETHTGYLAEPVRGSAGRTAAQPVWPPELLVEASAAPPRRPGSSCTTTPSATPPLSLAVDAIEAARGRAGAGRARPRHAPAGRRPEGLRAHGGRRSRRGPAAVLVHQGSRLRRAPCAGSSARAPTTCTRCAACWTPASRWRRRATTRSRRLRIRCSPSSAASCAATRSPAWTRSSGPRRLSTSRPWSRPSPSPARARTSWSTRRGRSEPGKSADLVVLSEDLLGLPAGAHQRGRGGADAVPRPPRVRRRPVRRPRAD